MLTSVSVNSLNIPRAVAENHMVVARLVEKENMNKESAELLLSGNYSARCFLSFMGWQGYALCCMISTC